VAREVNGSRTGGGLRYFWFEFEIALDSPCPPGAREGVGVTASDHDDATALIKSLVFANRAMPPVRRVMEDVSFHSLCPWAVLPNILEPWDRGVWFPAGYR
jgi:hypothetical protein